MSSSVRCAGRVNVRGIPLPYGRVLPPGVELPEAGFPPIGAYFLVGLRRPLALVGLEFDSRFDVLRGDGSGISIALLTSREVGGIWRGGNRARDGPADDGLKVDSERDWALVVLVGRIGG